MKKSTWCVFAALVFSVSAVLLGRSEAGPALSGTLDKGLGLLILAALLAEQVSGAFEAGSARRYFSERGLSLVVPAAYLALLVSAEVDQRTAGTAWNSASLLVLFRSLYSLLKLYGRMRRFPRDLRGFSDHPAQTILLSFLFVIAAGTLVLMMRFATTDGGGLPFVDALFTATSAVCVTGLTVADTAARFTVWGQAAILVLIQIGGLGIMALSFFTIFTIRRRVSLEDKMLLSYMLSEEDMSSLFKTLRSLVLLTVLIEAAGAALLYLRFAGIGEPQGKAVFLAVFHSVSAFCNAGFALYSDSLERYRSDPLVVFVVSTLIVSGGLGFGVITNLLAYTASRIRRRRGGERGRPRTQLSLNTRVTLRYTGILLLSGTALFYILEHSGSMKSYSLGEQYLSAFFQSVTLRTAGFNTVPFGELGTATYFFMIVYMFIGAGSGGTAGGVKVNTLAVLAASLKAFLRGRSAAIMKGFTIPRERVDRAYLVVAFGIVSVVLGTFVLTLTENAGFLRLLFETVSAFGTVGLSTGLTGTLSVPGRLVIVVLMYFGRLGPLTILSAIRSRPGPGNVSYPRGEISIG